MDSKIGISGANFAPRTVPSSFGLNDSIGQELAGEKDSYDRFDQSPVKASPVKTRKKSGRRAAMRKEQVHRERSAKEEKSPVQSEDFYFLPKAGVRGLDLNGPENAQESWFSLNGSEIASPRFLIQGE